MSSYILPEILYITNKNARHHLRFVEWEAHRCLVFGKDHKLIGEAFPDQKIACMKWQDAYQIYQKKNVRNPESSSLHSLYLSLLNSEIKTLDAFYNLLRKQVTHRRRGKSLAENKQRQAKKAATKAAYDSKGLTFIGNDQLISRTKKAAIDLAHTNISEAQISGVLERLVAECSQASFSEDEIDALHKVFVKKVDAMEQSITEIEATILRNEDKQLGKNAYHLYGLFKLRCEVGDTWALPQAKLAKELGVGKGKGLSAIKLLEKLGLIEVLEKGKRGTVTPKATIYRRLI